uniref:Uncharacterized protein n=1 Tax=Arundo donax TaxID=35708 RepID=A0A0A9CV85_ARUDO
MSSQSANMTLGSTGACGRTAAAAGSVVTVRQLESSADDDSTGSEELELAGRATRPWPFSLRLGLPRTSEPAGVASAAHLAVLAPSTRFLR